MMRFSDHGSAVRLRQVLSRPGIPRVFTTRELQLGLIVLAGLGVGLAVIAATYYVDNVKLLVGLVGGLAFVLVVMRWPEYGVLCHVALLSGLIHLGALPALHLGPISLTIGDISLLLLLGLVFLRSTAQHGFVLYGSPLILPLGLFMGAVLLSAANAILLQGINANVVLRTVRVLVLWTAFVPALQLVRSQKALRRLLFGLLVFSGILLIGVLLPNKLSPLLPVQEVKLGTGSTVYSGFTRLYYNGDMILYGMLPVTVASLAVIRKGHLLWRIALLGLLLYWAFRTGFRQYWLTLPIACALLLFFFSAGERIRLLKRLVPAIAAASVLVGCLMITQPTRVERIMYVLTHRLGSLLDDAVRSEASLQWRVIETRYALRQIGRHPTFGLGLASTYRPPMAFEEGDTSYSNWTYKYVENGYLWIALMMGLVGLVPFLWLCAAYLLRVFRHHHEIRDERLRAIYLGLGVAFVGMMACNLATPTFVIGGRLVFFPVAMAISEVILRLEREASAHLRDCSVQLPANLDVVPMSK